MSHEEFLVYLVTQHSKLITIFSELRTLNYIGHQLSAVSYQLFQQVFYDTSAAKAFFLPKNGVET